MDKDTRQKFDKLFPSYNLCGFIPQKDFLFQEEYNLDIVREDFYLYIHPRSGHPIVMVEQDGVINYYAGVLGG